MQIDSTFIDAAVAALSSLILSGISHGILKAKVERLEKDIAHHEDTFVAKELFNAVVDQLKDNLREMQVDLKEMQSDIKEVLHLTQKHINLQSREDS